MHKTFVKPALGRQKVKFMTLRGGSLALDITVYDFVTEKACHGRKSRKTNVDKHGMFTEISRIEGDNVTEDEHKSVHPSGWGVCLAQALRVG